MLLCSVLYKRVMYDTEATCLQIFCNVVNELRKSTGFCIIFLFIFWQPEDYSFIKFDLISIFLYFSSRHIQSTTQSSVQNNSHPSLLPAIMPVHTVRNNTVSLIPGHQSHHHSINQSQHCNIPPSQVTTSHFAAANFQIRKSCSHRCSWKCLAIFLIFVTVLLTAALAYFGGKA